MIPSVSSQLEQLANVMRAANGFDCLQIQWGVNPFQVIRTPSRLPPFEFIKQQVIRYIPGATHFLAPDSSVGSNSETIGYLSFIFGKERLQRIAEQAKVALSQRSTDLLTGTELESLCIHAAEIYERDLDELLNEIKGTQRQIRFLLDLESQALRDQFQGVGSLEECTNEQLDALFSLLIPFASISHLFFHNVPEVTPNCLNSGKLFSGLRDRVFLYEKMRRNPPTEQEWFMYIAKSLVNREMPEGVVFRNGHRGFCKVHSIVHGGGAYKSFLKQMGKSGSELPNVILYRGTRESPFATQNWQSLVEDVRSDLGSAGPKATYDATRELLTNPKKRFVRKPDEQVIGVGMSLGACHLMRDATLLPAIQRIIPIAGPGPDKATMQYFADRINVLDRTERMKITHYWEVGDLVHYLGGVHSGYNCDPRKAEITIHLLEAGEGPWPEQGIEDELRAIAKSARFPTDGLRPFQLIRGAYLVQRALAGPHCRNTLEGPHRVIRVTNDTHPELVQRLLAHDPELCDPEWEKMRQMIAFENDPFAEYVGDQSKK